MGSCLRFITETDFFCVAGNPQCLLLEYVDAENERGLPIDPDSMEDRQIADSYLQRLRLPWAKSQARQFIQVGIDLELGVEATGASVALLQCSVVGDQANGSGGIPVQNGLCRAGVNDCPGADELFWLILVWQADIEKTEVAGVAAGIHMTRR